MLNTEHHLILWGDQKKKNKIDVTNIAGDVIPPVSTVYIRYFGERTTFFLDCCLYVSSSLTAALGDVLRDILQHWGQDHLVDGQWSESVLFPQSDQLILKIKCSSGATCWIWLQCDRHTAKIARASPSHYRVWRTNQRYSSSPDR